MAASPLRATVLRAAVDYIAEHGPDGLSFRQVAAAAGVSHQAPYHHFADRKGIFQAIAIEGFTMFSAALREAADAAVGAAEPGSTGASSGEPDDPVERDPAVAMLDRYVEFATQHRGHFRVMFRPDLNGLTESIELLTTADTAFEVLAGHVERMLGPDVAPEDVRARLIAMWALAHGLAVLLIDGPLEAKLGPVTDRRAMVRAVAAQSD